VDSICNLGVVLDSKLNFTLHIDYLIVKASRMLSYIIRISKEFRDPYTLKFVCNLFVRSHLDNASVVWNPYYGMHLKRIEAIQKKFLRFALRTLGWSHDIELPPYCQRCRLIYLDILSSRMSCALFISDASSCKLDCPIILSSLRLNGYLYNPRYRFLLKEYPHRTTNGMNESLNGTIRIFNEFLNVLNLEGSKDGFRIRNKASVLNFSRIFHFSSNMCIQSVACFVVRFFFHSSFD
jgi:hypothetical protein